MNIIQCCKEWMGGQKCGHRNSK